MPFDFRTYLEYCSNGYSDPPPDPNSKLLREIEIEEEKRYQSAKRKRYRERLKKKLKEG